MSSIPLFLDAKDLSKKLGFKSVGPLNKAVKAGTVPVLSKAGAARLFSPVAIADLFGVTADEFMADDFLVLTPKEAAAYLSAARETKVSIARVRASDAHRVRLGGTRPDGKPALEFYTKQGLDACTLPDRAAPSRLQVALGRFLALSVAEQRSLLRSIPKEVKAAGKFSVLVTKDEDLDADAEEMDAEAAEAEAEPVEAV